MASVHRQAHSANLKIVFNVPGDGQWFRSCGIQERHLAIIVAHLFELEAKIAAIEGMTEHTAAQLERLIYDLLEYFTGRTKRQPLLDAFVKESVSLWSVSVTPGSANNLDDCATCLLGFAESRATKVRDLTLEFLKAYFEFLNSSKYSRGVVVMRRGFAKRVVKRAKEMGLLHTDPLSALKIKCKKRKVAEVKEHGITNPELETLYAYLDSEIAKRK